MWRCNISVIEVWGNVVGHVCLSTSLFERTLPMPEISEDEPVRAGKKALLGAGLFVGGLTTLVVILSTVPLSSVRALPSFARQTGLQCTEIGRASCREGW